MNYNYNFCPTYMFYDISLCQLNPIGIDYMNNKPSESIDDMDDSSEEEEVSNSDYNHISKYLYENELLYAFNLNNYDDNVINKSIEDLYNYIASKREIDKDVDLLLGYAELLSLKIILQHNTFTGFMILFSYDYFHLTHLCISDLLNEELGNKISKKYIDALIHCISVIE